MLIQGILKCISMCELHYFFLRELLILCCENIHIFICRTADSMCGYGSQPASEL